MTRVATRTQLRARMLAGDWDALQKEYRFKLRFVDTPDGPDLYWESLPVEINRILQVGGAYFNSATRKFWYSHRRSVAVPTPRNLKPNRQFKMPGHQHRYTDEERRQYAVDRAAFLKNNPWCEVALLLRGERVPATHVHHRKGRGPHYLDKTTFVATTADGDKWIHEHPEEARKLGLLE